MHENAITDNGILHVSCNQPHMVYEDTYESDMASVVFGNTYWDSQYTVGFTNLTTSFIFPTTVTSNTQTKYHFSQSPDRIYYLANQRKVYEWNEPSASPSSQYQYGVSFPKEGITWFDVPSPSGNFNPLAIYLPLILFCGVIIAFVVILASRKDQKDLMDYVPPFVSVPTAGARTDLLREEVAIILEKPAHITISMIILTLVDKGLLRPLSFEFPHLELDDGSRKHLRKYQRTVLNSIRSNYTIKEGDLIKAVAEVVSTTQERLKEYSYEKTVAYYTKKIKDATANVLRESDIDSNTTHEDWYWAILDEKLVPRDIRVEIPLYAPWYYRYHFSDWIWIPRGRTFTKRIARLTFPNKRLVSYHGHRAHGCACASCACACAGGGR